MVHREEEIILIIQRKSLLETIIPHIQVEHREKKTKGNIKNKEINLKMKDKVLKIKFLWH